MNSKQWGRVAYLLLAWLLLGALPCLAAQKQVYDPFPRAWWERTERQYPEPAPAKILTAQHLRLYDRLAEEALTDAKIRDARYLASAKLELVKEKKEETKLRAEELRQTRFARERLERAKKQEKAGFERAWRNKKGVVHSAR